MVEDLVSCKSVKEEEQEERCNVLNLSLVGFMRCRGGLSDVDIQEKRCFRS